MCASSCFGVLFSPVPEPLFLNTAADEFDDGL